MAFHSSAVSSAIGRRPQRKGMRTSRTRRCARRPTSSAAKLPLHFQGRGLKSSDGRRSSRSFNADVALESWLALAGRLCTHHIATTARLDELRPADHRNKLCVRRGSPFCLPLPSPAVRQRARGRRRRALSRPHLWRRRWHTTVVRRNRKCRISRPTIRRRWIASSDRLAVSRPPSRLKSLC